MSNDGTPIFPSELERLVFEMAAFSGGPMVAIKLMLVAKYVHDWIKPTIYTVFRQYTGFLCDSFPDFDRYPSLRLQDIGPFAKHLLIAGGTRSSEDITRLLTSCPNTQNLALWSRLPLCVFLQFIQLMPLKKLSADLAGFSEEDFRNPPFSFITHLDVVSLHDRTWANSWSLIATLPKLTHLSINSPVEIMVVYNLLLHCTNLDLLVVLQDGPRWYGSRLFIKELTSIEDVRLVLMEVDGDIAIVQDWEDGAPAN